MRRFLRLTLKNTLIFAALFCVLIAIGYLWGDLKGPIQWSRLIVTFPAMVAAIGAISAGQEMFSEWRERRKKSN